MVAWKRVVCAPVWSVHTPLWNFSVYTVYTPIGQPIDGTHACRHDKHAENPTVNVHSTVDDWPPNCFYCNCACLKIESIQSTFIFDLPRWYLRYVVIAWT